MIKLIPLWKQAWKFTCVIVNATMVLFDAAYLALPQFQALMTVEHFAALNGGFAAAAIVFRVIRQAGITISSEEKTELLKAAIRQPEKHVPPLHDSWLQ